MIATCSKCGTQATVTPASMMQFTLTYPSMMAATCKVLVERLKEKHTLSGDEMDCPHLSEAAAAVFNAWKSRQ